jgi:hypothetical protein
MPEVTRLSPEDPTIFAKCPSCQPEGRGVKSTGNYFAKAYTPRRWKRGPVCDNCETVMVKLFEVEVDE